MPTAALLLVANPHIDRNLSLESHSPNILHVTTLTSLPHVQSASTSLLDSPRETSSGLVSGRAPLRLNPWLTDGPDPITSRYARLNKGVRKVPRASLSAPVHML